MKRYIMLLMAALALSSCVSLKKIRYIQDASDKQNIEFLNEAISDYKVQPGDNLYIDIKSLDTKNMNPFQNAPSGSYQMNSDAGIYLNSYNVSDSGYIDFPVVGKILVQGYTVTDVKERLQKVIDEYFQMTTVTVKLVSFKISLLGEVARPGAYQVYQSSINIFQALSIAGDLNEFADRSNVKIIRKTKNGSTIHNINLLSTQVLESPYYYLQPEDIIYIEPLRGKNFTFTAFPYAIIFSTISTTLLILNFLK
ncbi:MAG: polysaccharide biosynthesis/export family protein [Lentimicrobium sp.]|nr:polysaccharide biosynthesis/export family protein [Lentimicrobium sp.]MDD2527819.1 polysaccharide biosynthesis/export family protein [Lentimicrobiaceae bacterium]MDD4598640.1 polysaccharide biosynthesis/export family protein [Lentimicrobiaceae bacterium]MDY0026054.1 polysaccharide biosynthesis/export family protein [Lentimicrobium sp.]HAH58360.1 hypothetical protein [Bacteroidales bacterium]